MKGPQTFRVLQRILRRNMIPIKKKVAIVLKTWYVMKCHNQ